MKLNDSYFKRIRGEQDRPQDDPAALPPEEFFCGYCRRKTIVLYKAKTNYGQQMLIQLKCPKCKREILDTVSFRSVSFRFTS